MHNGHCIHLCGYSHHDSAKWVADIRQEIENVKNVEEHDFEVLSGTSQYFLKIVLYLHL